MPDEREKLRLNSGLLLALYIGFRKELLGNEAATMQVRESSKSVSPYRCIPMHTAASRNAWH